MEAILYFNGTKIKSAQYPRKDMGVVQGLEDGFEWRIVQKMEKPVFDEAIEYLSRVTTLPNEFHPDYPGILKTVYTWVKIPFTQEQIDANLEVSEDNEAANQIDSHIEKGTNLVSRCERKIWRRRFKDSDANNKVTQGDARSLKKWFAPVYTWLILGNFQQAKLEMAKVITNNQVELDLVSGMITTAQWLETEILDYFNNQYDL